MFKNNNENHVVNERITYVDQLRTLSNNTINQYMVLTRKFFEDYCEIEIEKLKN